MAASSLPYFYSLFLDSFSGLIGSLLVYSGIKGTFIDPLQWSVVFGLPHATADTSTLMPSATGRNLGAGIFVYTLLLQRERKVLGIFLLCWTWAGIADTKVLFEHPQGTNTAAHMRNIVLLLVIGSLLIYDEAGTTT
ncbi:hypothetical protein F4808DRAFT_443171 [Astrocystis sublimbata]|nr:hypothetical protein F4808DRAFT_446385 [Astrocystis sublimbata]KAI0192443.1 hypothetical protein F4808DRAFT_443152 [Astrocystis sublimbata]KAI0192458.1 hypothetical protein F4808DRAFT_443171 [Astrocystis sublimbata]